jgi:hypothetical protein
MALSVYRTVLIAALAASAAGLFATSASAQDANGFATYRNERNGLTISYPAAQFIALPAASDDARLFVSKDDKARLLVGTLDNSDRKSLADYRTFVLRESYPGAAIDYAPIKDNWFVVSGVRGTTAFYQRVTFSCGGRKINSWAMLFPVADKATYEPIIEQVHKTYRVSDTKC